jgi:competence protein ComEC
MIIFIIFIIIISGFTMTISPLMGLFFLAANMLIIFKRFDRHKYIFICMMLLLTLGVYKAAEHLDYELLEEDIPSFTVTDYKYFKDTTAYIVKHEESHYELFTAASLKIGDRCTGHFAVTVPEEERNFIKKNDQLRLATNQVSGRIYDDHVQHCKDGEITWMMALNQLRSQYITKLLNSTEFAFKYDIITLSIGNKSYIDTTFFEALQKLGIYHLYVISGTHVAFITGVLFFAFKKMKITHEVIKWLLILSLIIFLLLNFFSPSVFRAVFMAVMLLLSSMFQKKPYLSIISLSAIIQVVINPFIIFHAGFQLSYITTYFILLSRIFFVDIHPLKQLLGMTIIAELSTLVVILSQFNEISLSGIVMNLIFVPLFSVLIFPAVILYNVLVLFNLHVYLESIYQYIFSWLQSFILYLGNLFKHRYPIRNMHDGLTILLMLNTYFTAKYLLLRHYKKLIILCSLFILMLFLNNKIYRDDFTLTMVDVGQGDAFLIEDHMNGKVIMIDTGGKFYINEDSIPLAEKTVLPYLKERGIDHIDLMILTHMDIDHMGEAKYIISKISVEHLVVNMADVKFKEWYEEIKTTFNGTLIDSATINTLNIGDVHIENMYNHYRQASDSSNDFSIVMKLHLNHYSFLMTGDMTEDMENALLEEGRDISADVLKLAHHGSATSSTEAFLKAVNFNTALVSAGVNNRYHHPDKEVIARVEQLKVTDVYNTQETGMTRFRIQGEVMCSETKLNTIRKKCIKKTDD